MRSITDGLPTEIKLSFNFVGVLMCFLSIMAYGIIYAWPGAWSIFLDGSVMMYGKNWRTGVDIGPGRLTVGQTFIGQMASLNLWDIKMANDKIKKMASSCSQELGNVTDWRMFRHGIQGSVEIRFPQSPNAIGKHFDNMTY